MTKTAIIDCGKDSQLYIDIATTLQHSLTGKKIFFSDHLGDLVNRHCPQLYDIADQAGFRFIPSNDKGELLHKPPQFWFDIVRKTALN